MSEQEKQEYNKVQLFIQNFGTFSLIKKILYLLPITVLWLVFWNFFDFTDFDSLLWLIPFTIPIFTSFYLIKLVWFNLILWKVETIKTKSIISIVFVVMYLGGFHGFDDVFKLYGKNDFVNIIDLIYLCIMCFSSFYLVNYMFLYFTREEEERVEVLRRLWFSDKYKNR